MKGFKLYLFNTNIPISEMAGDYNFAAEGNWILFSEFNENSSVTNTFDEVLHEEENSRYTLDFKIAKKSNWIGSLPNNFNFSDFIKIGRKLKLELDLNRKIFLTITNISPEGYGDNIIFNIQAVDFASYVFARNSTGLTFNSRTDEEFLKWLGDNYPGEKSTADRIIEYILIRGSLYDKIEGKGWSVSTTNDPKHPLKQNIGIELSSSNTYNALVEVALITNSFLVVDFITKKIGLTRRDHDSFRKNFILSPEFNLQELSLTYNSENFYPILYGIGGEDDRGLVVGLIPTLSFSQYRSLDKYNENFDSTKLAEYYDNPNFYSGVNGVGGITWEAEEPDENTIALLNRIPYLDTFIMDLSYFLEHELILEKDYEYIINKIFNDLRKINIKFQKVFMMKAMLENQIMNIENEIDNQTRTVNIAEDSNYVGDNEKLESLYFQEGGGLIPARNTVSLLENINQDIANFDNKNLVQLSSGGYTFYEVMKDAYDNYFSIPTESGGGGYTPWLLNIPLVQSIRHSSNGKYYVSGPFVQQYPLELTFTSGGHNFLNNFQAKNEWGPITRDVENYDFAPYVSSPTLYQFKSNMIDNKSNLNSTFSDLFATESPIVLNIHPLYWNQQLHSFTNSSSLNFISGSACIVASPPYAGSAPPGTLVYNFYNNRVYRYDGYDGCSAPYSKWVHIAQLSTNLNPFQSDRIYTLSNEDSSKKYIWSGGYSAEIGYLAEIKNIKNLFMKKAVTSKSITTSTNYTDPYSNIRIENSGLTASVGNPILSSYDEYIVYEQYYLDKDTSDYIYLGFRLRKNFPGTQVKSFTQINFPDGKKNWLVFGSINTSFPNESDMWSKIEKMADAGVINGSINLSGLSIGSNYTVSCTFRHPKIHLGYRVGGIIRFVHPSDPSIFYEGVLEESLNPNLNYIVNPDIDYSLYFVGSNIRKNIASSNITIRITKISNIDQATQPTGWTVVAPFLESDKHINLTSTTSGTATVRMLYWHQPILSYNLTGTSDPFTYEMNNATILLNKSQSDTIYSLHKYYDLLVAYKGIEYTRTKKLEDLKNDYIEAILEKNKIISEINVPGLAAEELASLESTLDGYRKLVGNSDYQPASEEPALEERFYEEGQNTEIEPSKLGELGLKYFNYLKYLNLYLENNEVNPDNPNNKSIYDWYMELKEQKQKLWFDLKEKFGDFLIEGYYENQTENDSYSLFLQTLENSKDYFKLAEDYSLTYLDGSQIIGKDLDLIEVGDFIKIRGEKLGVINNEKNEVQVSAISRDLRDFSNIALTVNKIRTNSNLIEKLLSSVAKK